ncbi:MAG: hypothetical protein AAGA71_05050 [Pseudomonadota bacterium]
MKHIYAVALTLALAAPGAASDGTSDMEEGLGLLGEGMQLLLRGLADELEPALRGFSEQLEGLDRYHAPEVLPNGDIIIRRKRPGEIVPEADAEEIEI